MADASNARGKTGNCEVCGKHDVRYRCPGCARQTCSLHCVRSHKKQYQCSGVACKTKFISQSDFKDSNLLSDYRFLEDVDRLAYSAIHDGRTKRKGWSKQVHMFYRKAKQSGVKLRLMPLGMSRRKENSSLFDKQKQCVMWRIRWIFPQAGVEYVDKRVSELAVVSDILKKYIDAVEADPVYKQRLKNYCRFGPHNVCVFLKLESQPANQSRYYQLNSSLTLRQCLANMTVVEFPVLHVVLPDKAYGYEICYQVSKADEDKEASHSTTEIVSQGEGGRHEESNSNKTVSERVDQ